MENYIQAGDYELWMIIENGPYIPVRITEDGKTVSNKPHEFGSNDYKKIEKTQGLRSCCTFASNQMSTLKSQSVNQQRRYGLLSKWLMREQSSQAVQD